MMDAQGLQYYDITVPVNQTQHLCAPGKYFRFYSGDADGSDDTITLRAGSGSVMCLLKPGQSIKLPENVADWYIGNYANTAAITGIVVVGNAEISDDNVSGTVSVVDGGFSRTRAGVAFSRGFLQPAVAGQNSHLQLFNPLGSGVNAYVESLLFSSPTAGKVDIGFYNTALTTDANPFVNKSNGGAGSACHARTKANAGILVPSPYLVTTYVQANAAQILNFHEPLMVPANAGLVIAHETVNADLTCNFEFYEQA